NVRSSFGGRVSSCGIYPADPPFFPAFNNTSATITEGPLNRQVKHSLFTQLRAYGELMRPANIVTAFADILAGFAAVGGAIAVSGWSLSADPAGLGWLLLSTFGLYGGGVVLNDVFDADLDATERPERAIPSGRVSRKGA